VVLVEAPAFAEVTAKEGSLRFYRRGDEQIILPGHHSFTEPKIRVKSYLAQTTPSQAFPRRDRCRLG